jgi:hypothetical protein
MADITLNFNTTKISFSKLKFQARFEQQMSIETHKGVKYLVADSNNSGIVHLAHWLALSHFRSCHVHHPAQVLVYVIQDGFRKHVRQLQ